jgi:hypothetical protein
VASSRFSASLLALSLNRLASDDWLSGNLTQPVANSVASWEPQALMGAAWVSGSGAAEESLEVLLEASTIVIKMRPFSSLSPK